MDPKDLRRLFNKQIEDGIDTLVEAVHYTSSKGHAVIMAECVTCGDLYGALRTALAKEILDFA